MNGPHPVRVVEGVKCLNGDVESAVQGQPGLLAQQVLKVLSLHVLHVDNDMALDDIHAVHPHDVRVLEPVDDSRLFEEAVEVGGLEIDLFKRHLLLQQCVPRQIDDAGHPVPQHVHALVLTQPTERHESLLFQARARAAPSGG